MDCTHSLLPPSSFQTKWWETGGRGQAWKQGSEGQRNTFCVKFMDATTLRCLLVCTRTNECLFSQIKHYQKKRVCVHVCVRVCVQVHNSLRSFSMWKFTRRLYYMRERERQRVCRCMSACMSTLVAWNRKQRIEVHICICAPWINTFAQWLVPTLPSHTNTCIPHQQTVSIMTS